MMLRSILSRLRATRGGCDRGAVLVEFAIYAPVVVLLGMGLVEFGLVYDESIDLNTSTRAAARAGSNSTAGGGAGETADYLILSGLAGGLADLEAAQIRRVVIYEASATSGAPPSVCLTTPINPAMHWTTIAGSNCNLYDGTFLTSLLPATPALWIDTYHGLGNADGGWFPAGYTDGEENSGNERGSLLEPSPPGPDYLGVYVEIDHAFVTGIFGSTISLDDFAVMRLEPQVAIGP